MADHIDPAGARDYRPTRIGKAQGAPRKKPISVTGKEQEAEVVSDTVEIKGKQPMVSDEDLKRYVNMAMNDEIIADRAANVAIAKSNVEQGLYGQTALDATVDGLLDDLRPLYE